MGDALTRQTISEQAEPAHAYDLFVVHAATNAEFVRSYLLPALNLPPSRVLRWRRYGSRGCSPISSISRSPPSSRSSVQIR